MAGQKQNFKMDDHEAAAALANDLQEIGFTLEAMEHLYEFLSLEDPNCSNPKFSLRTFIAIFQLGRTRVHEMHEVISNYSIKVADANGVR